MAAAFLSGLNDNYRDISHFANWHDRERYKKRAHLYSRSR